MTYLRDLDLSSGNILAIVVPYFLGSAYMERFLSSLDNQNCSQSIIIIFVDNSVVSDWRGVNDRRYTFQVVYIRTLPKIGFGRACNVGIQIASQIGAEWVMVVNQDVTFDSNAILAVTNSSHISDGIITPVIYDYYLEYIESHYIKHYLSASPTCVTQHFENTRNVSSLYETTHFSGACFAFQTASWNSFGLFDPVYYMYGEDNDLVKRLEERNIKFYISTEFKIGHEHGIEVNSNVRIYNLAVGLLNRLKSKENIFAKMTFVVLFIAKRLALILKLASSKKSKQVNAFLQYDIRTLRGLSLLRKYKNVEDRIMKTSIMDLENASLIQVFKNAQ